MKRISMLAIVAVLALGVATAAIAGTASGTTKILGPSPTGGVLTDGLAHEDTPTDVRVTINTTAPVVDYEYSLVNKCWWNPAKTSGPPNSYERFDLIGPWFAPETGDPAGAVVAYVAVNVQPVPEDAKCKVYIVKNNTVVKGSTTAYTVAAPPP
jgi:hypothetical protein